MTNQEKILKILHSDIFQKVSVKHPDKFPIDIRELLEKLFICLRSDIYQQHLDKSPFVIVVDKIKR